jgi:hypothetical protein
MIKISNIKYQISKIHIRMQNFFNNCAFCFVILIFTFCFLNLDVAAQPTSISSTELINNSRQYDGITVVFAGEVIGDVMLRGDFAWVNANDGENAIGIWMSKDLAGTIKFTGSYHSNGDRLEITGVFHRNCTQHGGDMDIHTQGIRIISPGNTFIEQLDITKRNVVYVILGVLFLVVIFVRRQKSS